MEVYIYKSDKPNARSLPRDENGKPLPIDGKHFNISHSGGYFAIAISNHPVGIDLQSKFKLDKKTNQKIPRELSARTLQKILKPGEKLVNNNYLYNFVIKEAYAKKLGSGLGLGFSTVDANDLLEKYHPYFKETKNYICYAFD
ncbi:hypothetical protein J6S35_00975 [Candidatus Saccharibacteria bacterium]|nr:hypothetical protein [Candidatus Saccharibacteria bacterium]